MTRTQESDDFVRRSTDDWIVHTSDDLTRDFQRTESDGEEPGGDSGQVETQGGGGGGGGGMGPFLSDYVAEQESGGVEGPAGMTVAVWVAVALVLGVGLWWTVRGKK